MIAIIDYGMGNLLSVKSSFEYLGEEAVVINDPAELNTAERIVLPGVGAFPDAMDNLKKGGWINPLTLQVLERKKPFLGICLGMQLLADLGNEVRKTKGLGWIPGEVVNFSLQDSNLKIPHVGWNNVQLKKNNNMLNGIKSGSDFYFVHSYHLKCSNEDHIAAVADYGGEFTAAIQKENIFATQFHPEKSQDFGLKIIENFSQWDGLK
jgi:imidazole glycerol-phosphate synthase subunit HisH